MKSKCPHCSHVIQIKEEWLGRKIKCPSCKEAFRLPEMKPDSKPKSKGSSSAKASPKLGAKSGAKSAAKPSAKAAVKSSAKPSAKVSAKAKPSSKKVSAKAPAKASAAKAPPAKKKRSAPGATMAGAAKPATPRKKRQRHQGNPYKGLVNTLLILAICAPYIFFHHNTLQGQRMDEIDQRVKENKANREKIANLKTLEMQMRKDAAEQARKDRAEAKASLNEEAQKELQSEEKRLSEAAFKSMMDEYLAIQNEMIKEREEKMGALKKKIAAETLKMKASDDVGQMQQAQDPFFKDNVINVFMNRCHKCHGNEEAKGGLRLHTLAATIQGGDGGPSIVPGDAEKSLLVELIKLDEDDDDIMPPKGGKLTDKEIAAIEKWINDGAKW